MREKLLKNTFLGVTAFKWILASLELIGGLILIFLNQNFITIIITLITQNELLQDPQDLIANTFIHWGTSLSLGIRITIAVYLIIHGILKLFLLYGLWKNKTSAYPWSMWIFSLFAAYQLYKYQFVHSIWLLILTAVDIIYILLVWHEYKILKRKISWR